MPTEIERAIASIESAIVGIGERLERIDRSLKTLVDETGELHHARVAMLEALEALQARLTLETSARKGGEASLENSVEVLESRMATIGDAVVAMEKRESERPPALPAAGECEPNG